MGSISGVIAKLSGSFATTLLLAYLLPVLLFAFLAVPLFSPLVPHPWIQYLELYPLEFNQSTLVKLSILGASTLVLYNFNVPIIQLYEGYYWEHNWIGKLLASRHRQRRSAFDRVLNDIRRLSTMEGIDPDTDARLSRKLKELSLARDTEYPPDDSGVLPTQLGNCIRCFERKSLTNYGLDAVTFWPHFSSIASERSLELVAESKRSFDFALNLAFLAGLGAIAAICAGLAPKPSMLVPHLGRWMLVFSLMACASLAFYQLALGRAKAWGVQVNAVIDLYNKDLIGNLGYDARAVDVLGTKRFWTDIGERIAFPGSPGLRYLPFKTSAGPGVISSPGPLKIDVIRCISLSSGFREIEWNVRNRDDKHAEMMEVFDDMPQGFALVSWSATFSDPSAQLIKTDPLTFGVNDFKAGQTITFKFQIAPVNKQDAAADL